MNPSIGIVVVAYGHTKTIGKLFETIKAQIQDGDKVVLIDNHEKHQCADIVEKVLPEAVVIRSANIGFARGCNVAASEVETSVDLLFFLNPDTYLKDNCLNSLRKQNDPAVGAWMGQLVLPDDTVNSAGNVVHMSGLSWCDRYGDDPKNIYDRYVSALSGADTVVTTKVWKEIGGFASIYFMYYEDTDLSSRIISRGYKLALISDAQIVHEYDFAKGSHKWFYIERNRYVYIFINWPLSILLLMAPLLVFIELGLFLVSIFERRFIQKIRALISFIMITPSVIKERIKTQKSRKISSREYLQYITPAIETPLLSTAVQNPIILSFFNLYYRIVKLIV
jgi:GT2 family glycosyltransferase